MEFREKPMQNLIRIKEKEICKNVPVSYTHLTLPTICSV